MLITSAYLNYNPVMRQVIRLLKNDAVVIKVIRLLLTSVIL